MKKHGFIWWFFIGWWWVLITWPFRIPVWIFRLIKRISVDKRGQTWTDTQETFKVTGISHRPQALEALGKKNPDFEKSEQELREAGLNEASIWEYSFSPRKRRIVELIPEPDNPVDKDAIKVVVDGQHIGYIEAEACAQVRKLLKEGRIQQIKCAIGGGRNKAFSRYGDRYILKSDFYPYSARLTITKKS